MVSANARQAPTSSSRLAPVSLSPPQPNLEFEEMERRLVARKKISVFSPLIFHIIQLSKMAKPYWRERFYMKLNGLELV